MTTASSLSSAARARLPPSVDVVVVGGGIAGVSAAHQLAGWGVSVALCEKGRIGAEQSSRNWGWIRIQGRDLRELPLMIESARLWREINAATNTDFGFRQGGATYLATTDQELQARADWLTVAKTLAPELDSRLLSSAETAALLQTKQRFKGALHTPSDAYAEPELAMNVLARLAERHGARLFEQTAVRTVERSAGRVSAVVTERGTVRASTVILAGGVWSRPFLENLGLGLPQLAITASVQRTTRAPAITAGTVGATGASIRRRLDGGYNIARTGAARFDIVPAAFSHLRAFSPILKDRWRILSVRLGRPFFGPLGRHRWAADQPSPFEQVRILDPAPDHRLLDDVLRAAKDLYPQLAAAEVKPARRWAGMIDVTPDELPVIDAVGALPGLYLATGLSGHGFGLGPGVGLLAAQLATGRTPVVDPAAFRYRRFWP